jgi:2-C-methyl-D-erythritol 2,4-cyclodiphosphate synthase
MACNFRVGHGFDVHAFREGDSIRLGGVDIPHHRAFKAHSDGDVLIHALCDALLGAAALGDIGQHFPDTDERYRGMDSRFFLREVVGLLGERGYGFVNADITIVAQAPKIAPHCASMIDNLASDLGCDRGDINVKATTTERLGYTGREEGIAVHAVALLEKGA